MGLNNLTYSGNGMLLKEQLEGCRLTAYQDQVGVWTIEYGHTGPDVMPGLTLAQEQAEKLLARDVSKAAACVNQAVTTPLSQSKFDALVDFVFNLGVGPFTKSTLLRDLNVGNFAGAAAQFDFWDHAGGAVVAGLLRRRQAKTALFSDGQSHQENT